MNPKKMRIHEVAKLTGITIRALHYYDEIGLLEPTKADKTKYRLYSENDLEKLQQILFYREVGFSLKEIKALLSAPVYNKPSFLNFSCRAEISAFENAVLSNVGAAPMSISHGMLRNFLVKQLKSIAVIANKLLYLSSGKKEKRCWAAPFPHSYYILLAAALFSKPSSSIL